MRAQVKALKRAGAPASLIFSFQDVCRINSSLPADLQSSFSTLLEEQCRMFGFHQILPEGWFFRPYTLADNHRRKDSATLGDDNEAPTIEQAYRRGYVQVYAGCRADLSDGKTLNDIKKQEKILQKWRVRAVQAFCSLPGDEEKPPKNLFGGRSNLSLSLRYKVFERDKFRCLACGRIASDGLTIEVDHIVAVAKGGDDSMSNLRTLCFDCNRGKSDS